MKRNAPLLAILTVGIAFVFFAHFDLLHRVWRYCDSWGCLFAGAPLYLAIGLGLIPLAFGVLGFAFAKQRRLRQAGILLVVSFGVMLLSILLAGAWGRIEYGAARGRYLAEHPEALPLRDPKRPITLVDQLNAYPLVVRLGAPLTVRAYARLDATQPDGTLVADIKVILPGTVERRQIATGQLLATEERSPDGRTVFAGMLSPTDSFGAKEGWLSVEGRQGLFDVMGVSFASQVASP